MIAALLLLVFLLFAFVVFRGAPYVPTRRAQIEQALALAKAKPGAHLVDLGSGDGAVLKVALEQGLSVTGYELNPVLVLVSRFRLRNAKHCSIVWGDYWKAKLKKGDIVYMFGVERDMQKLQNFLQGSGVSLVVYGNTIPGAKAVASDEPYTLYRY